MTMTMTEKERLELLKIVLNERFGELATRPDAIPVESNNQP
jgi:hypothetical protein